MKVTIVPAQVTTVEDRIVGNLGLNQLLLLAAPLFISSVVYIVVPPNLHNAPYKLAVMSIALLVCGLLAMRVRGKIILLWLVIICRYNLRPCYYIFNKNCLNGREPIDAHDLSAKDNKKIEQVQGKRVPILSLSSIEIIQAQYVVESLASKLRFISNKKGGLDVLITEVKKSNKF